MSQTTTAPLPLRKRWLRHAGNVALLLAVFLGVRALTQRGIASGAAPRLEGADLSGRAVSLADHAGKPVMVHFWGTWCPVCMQEIGTIDSLARDHDVLTVATNSGEADAIRATMAKHGVSFPVVVDAEGELARAWGVRAFPTSFFVTRGQVIRTAETGYTSSAGFRARLWLAGR